MTDPTGPTNIQPAEENPFAEIDLLLEAEDPDFAKSLEEVRSVVNDANVTIEASAIDEHGDEAEAKHDVVEAPDSDDGLVTRFKKRARAKIIELRTNAKNHIVHSAKASFIFLKTRPKEYFLYSIVVSKTLLKKTMIPVHAFQAANTVQRISSLTLTAVFLGAIWVLIANFKGIWLPQINEPLLHSFADHADRVINFNRKDGGESFNSAFPQERHEFLFPKMKVNLRANEDHPLPMGAFEVVAQLDSEDTAIEVRDREVEFGDLLQRVFEEETFTALETEIGKSKLKSRLKRELNQKLTQGWVKDINFKNFILKP